MSDDPSLAPIRLDRAPAWSGPANQFRLADLSVFESFVDAKASGDEERAGFYRNRLRPESAIRFEAWAALDPFNNPNAPTSPSRWSNTN